jgi:hypothetical protein
LSAFAATLCTGYFSGHASTNASTTMASADFETGDGESAAPEPGGASISPLLHVQAASRQLSFDAIGTLNVWQGEPLTLNLNLPEGQSFDQANVGRIIVRQGNGSQVALARTDQDLRATLEFRLQRPGPAMIVSCSGPSPDGRAHLSVADNTSCAKVILEVEDPQRKAVRPPNADALVTAKAGGPIELVPLRSPHSTAPGSSFYVRAYFLNSVLAHARMEVISPAGESTFVTTNRGGDALVSVSEPGIWRLRVRQNDARSASPREYLAELTFAIAKGQP